MVAYSHLRRRRGRAGHVPQIPSGVLCLGRDSYPGGAVVGAVINVDGVAAWVLSPPVDVYVLPIVNTSAPLGLRRVMYGVRCTVKLASLLSVIERLPCNKIFTLP
jgi:hypothetical protein